MKLTYEELYQAYRKARKGKSKKTDIIQRDTYLDANLRKIYQELITGTYTIQPTTRYIIQKNLTNNKKYVIYIYQLLIYFTK